MIFKGKHLKLGLKLLKTLVYLLAFMTLVNISGPTFKAIFNIYKIEKSYVAFNKSNDKILYNFVSKKPNNWKDITEISKFIPAAILTSEDGKFFNHQGFDFEQINKAIIQNNRSKKKIKGASTISQQLVKNLFLTKEKSYIRKAKEFYLTYLLESKISKLKILEIYINIVEFGDGIYGINEASQFYFKKDPKFLNPREAAFLAMLLPSPKKYSKSFFKKELTPYAYKTVTDILFKMKLSGYISESNLSLNLTTPMSFEKNRPSIVDELNLIESSTGEIIDDVEDTENDTEFLDQNDLDNV